jgi:L-idonate 5-dehydrogenase
MPYPRDSRADFKLPMAKSMLAAVLHGANDLRIESRNMPSLGPGEVLIRVRRAGICGSDMHYFEHGRCGMFVPDRPFILGHELVGDVAEAAKGVNALTVGTRVVVNPARACRTCEFCRQNRSNLCPNTIMLGSASTRPPVDGAFAEFVIVGADQCHRIPPELDDGLAALVEPLAVAVHALKRAGNPSGTKALIMGGGPIGLLTGMTAQAMGAALVCVTDILGERRHQAIELGLQAVLDPASPSIQAQARELAGDGFELVFEASGTPGGLRQAFQLVRPGGTVIQIGTIGTEEVPLPANEVMVREIQYLGSFRYGNDFEEAVHLAASGKLALQRMISRVFPLREATQAIATAFAKDHVLKVQLQNSA